MLEHLYSPVFYIPIIWIAVGIALGVIAHTRQQRYGIEDLEGAATVAVTWPFFVAIFLIAGVLHLPIFLLKLLIWGIGVLLGRRGSFPSYWGEL